MNPAIAGAVFAIIFVGELPDKTMLAALVMSTRGRPFEVWLGSAAAFFAHVLIATILGTVVFHLLSPRVLDGVVAAMFLAGAGLAATEAVREHRRNGQPEPPPPVPPLPRIAWNSRSDWMGKVPELPSCSPWINSSGAVIRSANRNGDTRS